MGAGAVDRLAYEVLEGAGPVALFCGGRFTTRSYWRRNVEVLEPSKYKGLQAATAAAVRAKYPR